MGNNIRPTKGSLNAVKDLFPNIEHRMCTRYIYANWRKKYRSPSFQKPFWKCAKASSVIYFNWCRAKLAQLTVEGAKDMMNNNPKHWSRAWFNLGSHCYSVDNNMCESFNNWIVDVRAHPIISLLEGIRTKVYVRIQQNQSKALNWSGRICPNILKKSNKYIDLAENCSAMWNGNDEFEVDDKEKKKYIVDLEQRTCFCRYWQLAGIPCARAITALHVSSKPPEDYIVDCYSIEHHNKIYDHCMLPMQGMDQWPETEHRRPQPPAYVKMTGRPRKERRREPGEAKKSTKLSRVERSVKCGRCNKSGHNVRSCTAVASEGKRMRRVMEKGKEVLESSGAQKATSKNKNDAAKNKKGKEVMESRGSQKAPCKKKIDAQKKRSTQPSTVHMLSHSSVNDTSVKRKYPATTKIRTSPSKKEVAKRRKT